MKIRLPLYAQMLGWFFLNLLFLAVVFYGFFRLQLQSGFDSLLLGHAGERIQANGEIIAAELRETPRKQWDDVLERFSAAYRVEFYLFRGDGAQLAGPGIALPPVVRERIRGIGRPGGPNASSEGGPQNNPFEQQPPEGLSGNSPENGRGMQGPPESLDNLRQERRGRMGEAGAIQENGKWTRAGTNELGPFQGGGPGPLQGFMRQGRFGPMRAPAPKFMLSTDSPKRYWVGMRLGPMREDSGPPRPATLVAVSDSLSASGLFIDIRPWLLMAAGAITISALFWLPLARSIARSVSQMTHATEEIAAGRFETRVSERRPDELGRLGGAVNRMAARLAGFVTGQKRFLGDIAHELCSPIARIQLMLGIFEQNATGRDLERVEDLREEVVRMSDLVNELLSFSKASLQPSAVKLGPVGVLEIAERAARREGAESVQCEMDPALQAVGAPDLLLRALANLVRNAVRYAGSAGPIRIVAAREGAEIAIRVVDSGPGVPPEAIARLFDPFYRPELARTRETGGAGLGLAIVKTCVESCQGAVSCRNLVPRGFEVEIRLKAAE